jgi:hypothetical protein
VYFVAPGEDVYAGMVVGEANRGADLDVNIAREKKLTNVRSVEADAKMLIAPPRQMSLEEAIGYVSAPPGAEAPGTALGWERRLQSSGRGCASAQRFPLPRRRPHSPRSLAPSRPPSPNRCRTTS